MKISFFFYLLCFCINSYAITWVQVTENEHPTVIFVDIDSIRKVNDYVFFSSLQNMTSMGLNSVIFEKKVSCLEKKVIKLKVTFFGQTMGQGIPYEEENIIQEEIYPKPNTANHKVMKFVCDHEKMYKH